MHKAGKDYDPPCEFCGHLDDYENDSKFAKMFEDLEKLPNLVEEVCRLNEELEELEVSLNSSFDLDEVTSFEPTCCETSIVKYMGMFCQKRINLNTF